MTNKMKAKKPKNNVRIIDIKPLLYYGSPVVKGEITDEIKKYPRTIDSLKKVKNIEYAAEVPT